jgi:tetratricopeptide (TPR) repeat protein
MTAEERRSKAVELLREAYSRQMSGDLDGAIDHYERSIEIFPTAEAHTFLGWTYSFQRRYDEAIAECKRAIAVDANFGRAYNDIGEYLIELERYDEAVPWLERAVATRSEPRHHAHHNLGRVWRAKGQLLKAVDAFERALALASDDDATIAALGAVRRTLN